MTKSDIILVETCLTRQYFKDLARSSDIRPLSRVGWQECGLSVVLLYISLISLLSQVLAYNPGTLETGQEKTLT